MVTGRKEPAKEERRFGDRGPLALSGERRSPRASAGGAPGSLRGSRARESTVDQVVSLFVFELVFRLFFYPMARESRRRAAHPRLARGEIYRLDIRI